MRPSVLQTHPESPLRCLGCGFLLGEHVYILQKHLKSQTPWKVRGTSVVLPVTTCFGGESAVVVRGTLRSSSCFRSEGFMCWAEHAVTVALLHIIWLSTRTSTFASSWIHVNYSYFTFLCALDSKCLLHCWLPAIVESRHAADTPKLAPDAFNTCHQVS